MEIFHQCTLLPAARAAVLCKYHVAPLTLTQVTQRSRYFLNPEHSFFLERGGGERERLHVCHEAHVEFRGQLLDLALSCHVDLIIRLGGATCMC